MQLDDAIAACEAAGLTVVRPRETQDEQLRDLWDQIMKLLRMAHDMAEDGARLRVRHPPWLPGPADPVGLLRSSAERMVRGILAEAVVEREMADAAE